jgi:hypothetical protein
MSIERRRSKRREILENFSFYICVPKLGFTRHKVNNVSETGIGFSIETLGEFRLGKDEQCNLQFYLNQSLYLPLNIQVIRDEETDGIQNVGAILLETQSNEYQTFLSLVRLLDQLVEFAQLRP